MDNAQGSIAGTTPERLKAVAVAFGSEPLLTRPNGTTINLASGYIPLLARFTFEDKAAKGLRKRGAGQGPETPIFFSALELVRDNRLLMLTGPAGSGKTTFAKYLCFRLATHFCNSHLLICNELGDIREESWETANTSPFYFAIEDFESLKRLAEFSLPTLLDQFTHTLIVIDAIEKAGEIAQDLLNTVFSSIREFENVQLLVLTRTDACERWVLPPGMVRHELLPLLKTQRRQAVFEATGVEPRQVTIGLGPAAENPAVFILALQAGLSGDRSEEILDQWLSVVAPTERAAQLLAVEAFNRLSDERQHYSPHPLTRVAAPAALLSCDAVQNLLAARHLATLPWEIGVELFHRDPRASEPILRSVLARLGASGRSYPLIEGLLLGSGIEAQRGALLVADLVADSETFRVRVTRLLLDVISQATLSITERVKAGRILSRLGDPRDLTALAGVPAGTFVLGSDTHPNSQPLALVSLGPFRIGVFPVVNRDYLAFVQETGRHWPSPDGADEDRATAPATDVSWHDATEYCIWLTRRWRASGKIGPGEEARLPTEPEWERASRGDQNSEGPVYTWGTRWQADSSNSEETGLNTTCAVGLFPRGASPYGCHDMAGHVWEWCTTLWGDDMATPSFRYPWQGGDGREAKEAPPQVRRVLRGGCFSSGAAKVTCTYRGSLEPAGFWRGNGFRVVVAPVPVGG
ncbi:uncharacterized protein DNG_01705 [Cephalotrichum gorgonifer]|uniref:Uncharacterized protein n=1 Tax=Cephalotrichum gorgonifer TaxID=2041049 RepID=A0AAE8SRV7_9PEZI|nr:uncharacterized protein DNG_01705 [Cephalotrichum gorgonifer]